MKTKIHLDSIKTCLNSYFKNRPVLRAFLFGSYSRNEEVENSDIDILVELDYSKPIGFYFFTMQYELSQILSTKVDLVTKEELSTYIKSFVEKDMIQVYER